MYYIPKTSERRPNGYLKSTPQFKLDIEALIESLEQNPKQGRPLGKDCYKVRMAIPSQGKGKSGGARIITCVVVKNTEVYLLTVYVKSENESVSDKELIELRNQMEL